MKNMVLYLVASCENRISMIEELVTGAHYAATTLEASLGELGGERARLKDSLQEIFARNCSLRRKDFNALMERIISDSEMKKGELEEEREHVKEALRGYLEIQRQLVASVRRQLVEFAPDNGDKDTLERTLAKMKAAYQHQGQQVFALLRNFQLRLESFQKAQEEINQKLQRLVARGDAVRLEELRQLQAAEAGHQRKVEGKLRRQDVERLLAHFKGQRQGGNHVRW